MDRVTLIACVVIGCVLAHMAGKLVHAVITIVWYYSPQGKEERRKLEAQLRSRNAAHERIRRTDSQPQNGKGINDG